MRPQVALPGQSLGSSTSFRPGPGVYSDPSSTLRASLASLLVSTPSPSDPRPLLSLPSSIHLPVPGSLVTARITRTNPRFASADLLLIYPSPSSPSPLPTSPSPFKATIRAQDVLPTPVQPNAVYDAVRPGDIVVARVIAKWERSAGFLLSIAEDECGVVVAWSEGEREKGGAIVPMEVISQTQMKCPVSGAVEKRKVAVVKTAA